MTIALIPENLKSCSSIMSVKENNAIYLQLNPAIRRYGTLMDTKNASCLENRELMRH